MKGLKLDTQSYINFSFVVIFFVILWTPFLSKNINPYTTIKETLSTSNAILATKGGKSLRSRIEVINDYWGNSFGFRDRLINLNNEIYAKYNNYVRAADLFYGKDGWLFYSQGLGDTWKQAPYTEEQQKLIFDIETSTSNYFASKNILYIKVMPPDKHEIYPEFTNIKNVENLFGLRREQFANILKQVNGVHYVDVDPPLIEAKKNRQVFYKSDTHWNNYGSFIAYQEIAKELKKKYPNIEILEESDFNISEVPRETVSDLERNLQQTTNDMTVVYELKPEVVNQKLSDDKKIDKGLFIIDSYFDEAYEWGTVAFLKKHFKDHAIIFNHLNITPNDVEAITPNVIIHEIVERSLN